MTVSIIVPVYNTEKYLSACIESCLAQTYANIEIILVDDGSTDSSPKVLLEYERCDRRIRVVRKKNEGVAIARQEALKHASGEWIFFLDSDDCLLPDTIEQLAKHSDEADMVVGAYVEKGESGKHEHQYDVPRTGFVPSGKYLSDILTKKVRWALWGNLIKKSLLENVVMPTFRVGEDASVLVQLICRANRIFFISDPVYIYLQRLGSTVHTRNARNLTDILRFRMWIRDYLSDNSYGITQEQTNVFVADGFAECLLLGGYQYLSDEWKEELRKLNTKGLALWQAILIRAYATSSRRGAVIRLFIWNMKGMFDFIKNISLLKIFTTIAL